MSNQPKITLRPIKQSDIPLLEHWDKQPHVIAAKSDEPNERTEEDTTNWHYELTLIAPDYQYFIAELGGRPIGIMQIIDPHTEQTHYWSEIEPNLRAIDIWIGGADDLGKGYGEQMMRQAFKLCFQDPFITAIVIDPLASNTRACKFYCRIGFVEEGRRLFEDDDCLVHRLTREDWKQRFPDDESSNE